MATWTWSNSNLTAASAKCFASDVNGHIIAGTTTGVYYSSQSTPGVWTLCNGATGVLGISTDNILGVASTADGSAMFAITNLQTYYSIDYGHTWNYMDVTPSGLIGSICCNGSWAGGGYVNIVITSPGIGFGTTFQLRTQQIGGASLIMSSLSSKDCIGVTCNSTGTKYTLITSGPEYIYDSDGTNINAGVAIVWNQVSGTQKNWTSVACSKDGSKFVACESGGTIWTSTVLQSWAMLSGVPSNSYNYAAISDDGTKLYACYPGGYVYSLNGGSTWASDTSKSGVYAIYINPIATPDAGLPLLLGANRSAGTYGIFYVGSEPQPICFKEGSQILCLIDGVEKYIPVETITPGTLVKTYLNGYKPVAVIGFSKVYNPGNGTKSIKHLVKCTPANYPELTEDLVVTGAHSILVNDITDKQRADLNELAGRIFITDDKYRLMACLDDRSEPYDEIGLFTIWHFALEHTQYTWNYGVYANGLLVETASLRMMKEFSGMTLLS